MGETKQDIPTHIDEVLVQKQSKKQSVLRDTHIEGFRVRALKDSNTALGGMKRKDIRALATATSRFSVAKKRLDSAKAYDAEVKGRIKKIAQEYPELQGTVSDTDRTAVTVFPTSEVSWKPKELHTALGGAYTAVVHDIFSLDVSIPAGLETDKGPFTADLLQDVVQEGLRNIGVSEDVVRAIMRPTVEVNVDEEQLAQMVGDGRLSLADDVADIKEGQTVKPAKYAARRI